MRIAHLSDIHLRLKDRQDEYEEVFANLYVELNKLDLDEIVLVGDIFHSKNVMSPEVISVARKFLKRLADIARLRIIIGNHDFNMANNNRLDSISPIIESIGEDYGKGISYYTDTGLHEVQGKNLVYGVYSLLDGKTIKLKKSDKDPDKIYVAMFHGPIGGSKTDTDYMFSDTSTSIRTFANFDFGMFGDIHKSQTLNKKKTIAYCGSLIQQNYGESINKGFLFWDITDKETFNCEFIPVKNDHAFYTFDLSKVGGEWPELDLPEKCRMRVLIPVKANAISKEKIENFKLKIKEKYNPYSLIVKFKPISDSDDVSWNQDGNKINVNDFNVQEDLLRTWAKDSKNLETLLNLDREVYESVNTVKMEDFSNSIWELKKITIDNFMSFDGPVEIDFEKLDGVIGIFGGNAVGKSVIIDAILYAFFDKITRKTGNDNLINKYTGRNSCGVTLELLIGGMEYILSRSTIRKVSKKTEKVSSSTSVSIKRRPVGHTEWEDITGAGRRETEKAIRNTIGEYDDFMITALSTENKGDGNEFIHQLPSQRTDSIIRFLGLSIFTKKFDFAKETLKTLELESKQFNKDNELEFLLGKNKEKDDATAKLVELDGRKDKLDVLINKNVYLLDELNGKMNKKLSFSESLGDLNTEYGFMVDQGKTFDDSFDKLGNRRQELSIKIRDIDEKYVFDIEKLEKLYNIKVKHEKIVKKINELDVSILTDKQILMIYKKDLGESGECPVLYDDNHVTCNFLMGYFEKKRDCIGLIKVVEKKIADKKELEEKAATLEYSISALDQQLNIKDHLSKAYVKLQGFDVDLAKINGKIEVNNVSMSLVEGKIKVAEDNEDIISENLVVSKAIDEMNVILKAQKSEIDLFSKDIMEVSNVIAVLEHEIATIGEKIQSIDHNFQQLEIYREYCSAMHRDGIPTIVLKNYISTINYEINKVLINVTNFTVYMDVDETSNINIYMMYDGKVDDRRPAQMGSGMERLLINFAIRYALLSVSNMNRPNTWFIDEGFGVLTNENLSLMERFFESVRSSFRNIIIITHIEELKDVADYVINITQKDRISQVSLP